jgi:hypothetical protein
VNPRFDRGHRQAGRHLDIGPRVVFRTHRGRRALSAHSKILIVPEEIKIVTGAAIRNLSESGAAILPWQGKSHFHRQRRRRGIFVENRAPMNPSSVRSGIFRPDGALNFWGSGSTKMPLLTELELAEFVRLARFEDRHACVGVDDGTQLAKYFFKQTQLQRQLAVTVEGHAFFSAGTKTSVAWQPDAVGD